MTTAPSSFSVQTAGRACSSIAPTALTNQLLVASRIRPLSPWRGQPRHTCGNVSTCRRSPARQLLHVVFAALWNLVFGGRCRRMMLHSGLKGILGGSLDDEIRLIVIDVNSRWDYASVAAVARLRARRTGNGRLFRKCYWTFPTLPRQPGRSIRVPRMLSVTSVGTAEKRRCIKTSSSVKGSWSTFHCSCSRCRAR
jgi:hypothetical protein